MVGDCVDLPTESNTTTHRLCWPGGLAVHVWSAVIMNWPTGLVLFVTATCVPSTNNWMDVTPLLSVAVVCTVTC
jgi:hypothetical protein